ncbi:methyl-accepting chemotaxis protein [Clostridium butyricum]|uniref:methyl-accepting chemotaxis protein n=1 Tax=Clostridium butyricum TaxID=1492 RepID=UPI003D34697D
MLQNLKIRTKINGIIGILIGVIIMTSLISVHQQSKLSNESLNSLENVMRYDYDNQIKNQVDGAITVIKGVYRDYENGKYTEEEAKLLAANLVRQMRYGENGYFWIDTYDGNNVVLLGDSTEGTNRMNSTDVNGYKMIQEIIAKGKNGGGYTDYYFPKEGESEVSPKRAYSKAFEPFNWVIGTGNYTDDIDKEVAQKQSQLKSIVAANTRDFAIIVISSIALCAIFSIILSREILKGFKAVSKSLEIMSTGDFKEDIPEKLINRKDDFGIIAKSLKHMHDTVQNLIYEAKNASDGNNEMAVKIGENINVLNEDIENISAVAEELAAGMEECAASSEEMAASAHEINAASEAIAKKSEEGSAEAIEISKRAKITKKKSEESKVKAESVSLEIQKKLEVALEGAKIVDKINVLADTILSITEQTNLLALNAAIEAARAGEAGKGFSVVAEEIRSLAEQSKEAVENIQNVTKDVTNSVASLSDNSNMLLNFVKEDVSKDYDSFIEVAEKYENDAAFVEGLITDFSATAEELTASLDNVLTAIDEVAKTASEGAQGTTEISQRAIDIQEKSELVLSNAKESIKYSDKIKDEMNKFTI